MSTAKPAPSAELVSEPNADPGGDSINQHVHGPDCDHGHQHAPVTFRRETPKLGRNDPCHCGSGKKFKKCHGGEGA